MEDTGHCSVSKSYDGQCCSPKPDDVLARQDKDRHDPSLGCRTNHKGIDRMFPLEPFLARTSGTYGADTVQTPGVSVMVDIALPNRRLPER